jgi:large subunit ribosomal protein L3
MGHVTRTIQNLKIVKVDGERNLLFIRGSIPGPTGGIVEVRKAVKGRGKPTKGKS